MSYKPKYNEETFLRILSLVAEAGSDNEKNIRESLKEEGLNPDEVLKAWDTSFKKKFAEFKAKQKKQSETNKNSIAPKNKPKGPRL